MRVCWRVRSKTSAGIRQTWVDIYLIFTGCVLWSRRLDCFEPLWPHLCNGQVREFPSETRRLRSQPVFQRRGQEDRTASAEAPKQEGTWQLRELKGVTVARAEERGEGSGGEGQGGNGSRLGGSGPGEASGLIGKGVTRSALATGAEDRKQAGIEPGEGDGARLGTVVERSDNFRVECRPELRVMVVCPPPTSTASGPAR